MSYRIFPTLVLIMAFSSGLTTISLAQDTSSTHEGDLDRMKVDQIRSERAKREIVQTNFDPFAFAEETRTPRVTTQIPAEFAEQYRTDRVANQRLLLTFTRDPAEQEVLAVEYEGEESEVPVIAGFWIDEECETDLNAETYRKRDDRDIKTAFMVKSRPRNFGAYEILIEHHVVTARRFSHVKTISLANYETFEKHKLFIPGMMPGVNRLNLKIRFKNDAGVETTSKGVPLIVTVSEVAAFGVNQDCSVTASKRSVGDVTVYTGAVTQHLDFTLTSALDPEDVEIRVVRRGVRDIRTEGAGVRTASYLRSSVKETIEHEIARVKLIGGENVPGVTVRSTGKRSWRISLEHEISTVSTLLPVSDNWSYKLQIRDIQNLTLHDQFDFAAGAAIKDGPADSLTYEINGARHEKAFKQ